MSPRRIAVEGPNGVGKSTVAAELARLLSPSAIFAYPSEAPPLFSAKLTREERAVWYLNDMDARMLDECERLEEGRSIIRDRDRLSTEVYQAGTDDDFASWIRTWSTANGIVPADVTLVLYLPDDERERRLAASPRGARAELGDAEERARIARLYRHHAATYPGAVEVSAEGPLEEVVARCMAAIG